MFERTKRFFAGRREGARIDWLSPDLAIGSIRDAGDWPRLYDAGVRAVVDIRFESQDLGRVVRDNGLRYLRLCVPRGGALDTGELHVATGWVLDRIAEDDRVLVQDGEGQFNDGLLAAAALIKGGMPAHMALLALRRTRPNVALDPEQRRVLVQFATELRAASYELRASEAEA